MIRAPSGIVVAGEPVGVATRRRSARGWRARARATARSAGAAATIRSPMIVWRRMSAHSLGVQRPGLVEDRVGDRDLADVVQVGGVAHLDRPLGAEARAARRPRRRGPATVEVWSPSSGSRSASAVQQDVAALAAGRRPAAVLARVHALVGELQCRRRRRSPRSGSRPCRSDAVISKPSPAADRPSRPRAATPVRRRRPDPQQRAELVAAHAVGACRGRRRSRRSSRPRRPATRRRRCGRSVSL